MKKFLYVLLIGSASLFFSACSILDSKTKAGLQVITNDVPVSLFLDDQYLDKTPYINKEIKPGKYTLKIVPEDTELTPYETSINLNKGLLTVVTWKPGKTAETSGGVIYEMETLSNKKESEVSFITIPDNTIINFDNQEPQFAPLILQGLEPGHHEFEIKLPSYETQKHTINVVEGHRLIVSAKLAKNSGSSTPSSETANTLEKAEPSTPGSQIIPEVTIATLTASEDAKLEAKALTVDGAKVKILPTNFFQNGEEVLRVRDSSGPSGNEIGFAKVKSEYSYLGETKNGWYKIQFEQNEGWVSATYAELLDE